MLHLYYCMTTIPVHETFQNTIQGEGHWAGAPVDFIRLHGCPVGCNFCDTGYADGGKNAPRELRDIDELVSETRTRRVVISGGEPFIQPNLKQLVHALIGCHKLVHIETSGAFWQEVSGAWVTLSPKHHLSPKYPVDQRWWNRADEIKIVISSGTELEFYAPFLQSATGSIYLQPEWNDRARTLPLTLDLLKQNPKFRLSVQLHKMIGVQ